MTPVSKPSSRPAFTAAVDNALAVSDYRLTGGLKTIFYGGAAVSAAAGFAPVAGLLLASGVLFGTLQANCAPANDRGHLGARIAKSVLSLF